MAIKDWRFEDLSRSTQVLAFTVLTISMAFVIYRYVLKGPLTDRSRLRVEISRLESFVANGTAIEGRIHNLKRELARMEQRLSALQSILPTQKETTTVLKSVQQMAASSNLKINRFVPQPVVPHAFYSDWPIALEVEGNYDGLGLFFEKVAQANRIIDVDAISIKGVENATDASRTLNASCTATTFVFREDQSAEQDSDVKEKRR
jgi:Tfp pilus assembly protein PilO